MTADLGLITHTPQSHTAELTSGCARNRFTQRGLAHSGRTHQTQDGALGMAHTLLHRKVFKDAFLDLLQPVVITVEHLLSVA